MEVKTEAVVLQSIDYQENDKILTLFSPTLGKIVAGIKGVKKPKAKLAFSAQPFCFAEYVLATKNDRYTVTSAYLHESFFEIRTDVESFYSACAMAEACRLLTLENESYQDLFIGFIQGLQSLCSGDDAGEVLINFLMVVLRELGYPIDLSYFEECDGDIGDKLWFDFSDGKFTSFERCNQGERASVSTYHVLRRSEGLTYDEHAVSGGNKRALRLLKAYLTEKTETSLDGIGEFIRIYEEK